MLADLLRETTGQPWVEGNYPCRAYLRTKSVRVGPNVLIQPVQEGAEYEFQFLCEESTLLEQNSRVDIYYMEFSLFVNQARVVLLVDRIPREPGVEQAVARMTEMAINLVSRTLGVPVVSEKETEWHITLKEGLC